MADNTYYPIGASEPYENSFFGKLPIPSPGFAFVLTGSREQDAPLLIQHGSVPEKGQVRRGSYNQITRVDIGSHDISFEVELPSSDNISRFFVRLSMSARVYDPHRVIADHVTDAAAAVRSRLTPQLENIACRCAMEQLQDLRERILSSFKEVEELPCGISLTNISVQVRPDAGRVQHWTKIQGLEDKKEYEETRAKIARALSEQYQDPVTQAFAEFASDQITVEEAARRLQERSAKNFDESMRQYSEILRLVRQAQDMGVASPEVLEEKTAQLFSALLNTAGAAGLGAGPKQDSLYAPPSDQEDDEA